MDDSDDQKQQFKSTVQIYYQERLEEQEQEMDKFLIKFQQKFDPCGSDDEQVKQMLITNISVRGIAGLANLVNSSVINTAVQCLSNTYALTEYFIQNKYFDEINLNNPLGTQGQLVRKYGSLIKQLWCGNQKVVFPKSFKKIVEQFQPMFKGFQQHDFLDVLSFILDGLHEDLNRIKKKPYVEMKDGEYRTDLEVAKDCWEYHIARNQSIILDIFHGQFKLTLKCSKCNKISTQFDPFISVQLAIPNKKLNVTEEKTKVNYDKVQPLKVTLYDCLKNSEQPEVLEEANQWYCKQCKDHVNAIKCTQIYKISEIVIFLLQRFKGSKGNFRQKLETFIEFPVNGLDLTNFILNKNKPQNYELEGAKGNLIGVENNSPLIYDLYAVSNHFGDINSGHYTAFAKNHLNGKWYNFDDSYVIEMDEVSVISKSAYVLFYKRRV